MLGGVCCSRDTTPMWESERGEEISGVSRQTATATPTTTLPHTEKVKSEIQIVNRPTPEKDLPKSLIQISLPPPSGPWNDLLEAQI